LANITNTNTPNTGMPTTYKKVLSTSFGTPVVTTQPSSTYVPTSTTRVTNVAATRPVVTTNATALTRAPVVATQG
jgi:hypothetical protein